MGCNSCGNEGYYSPETGCSQCNQTSGCSDPCAESCGCDVKIGSLTCITHNGTNLDCIGAVTGDNLEFILTKINTAICALGGAQIIPADGMDGQGIDHVSFTSSTSSPPIASQPGGLDTYTMWADAGETISVGTAVFHNGVDGVDGANGANGATGQGVDHSSFTSTTDGGGLAGAYDAVDTYTLWGDVGETIVIGTFIVQQPANPDSVVYDSDWITIPYFDALEGFGLPGITSGYIRPKIRVVGRTVFIEGKFLMPLNASKVISSLGTSAPEYYNLHNDKSEIFSGVEGGFTSSTGGTLSASPIIPMTLAPSTTVQVQSNAILTRPIVGNVTGSSIMLNSFAASIAFRGDGKLWIHTFKDTEEESVGSVIQSSPLYASVITSTELGQAVPDYTLYRHGYLAGVDQRLSPANATELYPLTFDGRLASNLGGFYVPFSMSYPLGASVTQSQIDAAIASL